MRNQIFQCFSWLEGNQRIYTIQLFQGKNGKYALLHVLENIVLRQVPFNLWHGFYGETNQKTMHPHWYDYKMIQGTLLICCLKNNVLQLHHVLLWQANAQSFIIKLIMNSSQYMYHLKFCYQNSPSKLNGLLLCLVLLSRFEAKNILCFCYVFLSVYILFLKPCFQHC